MTAYLLRADLEGYQDLSVADDEDWAELNDRFKGEPIGGGWRPVKVRLRDDDLAVGRRQGDFPRLGGNVPVFSQRAIEALGSVLTDNGEILPLICEQGHYHAFNCTRVADALDLDRSEVDRFPSGRIFRIRKHELRPEALEGLAVFKLAHAVSLGVYVTDQFAQCVRDAGLKGFDLRPAWTGCDALPK